MFIWGLIALDFCLILFLPYMLRPKAMKRKVVKKGRVSVVGSGGNKTRFPHVYCVYVVNVEFSFLRFCIEWDYGFCGSPPGYIDEFPGSVPRFLDLHLSPQGLVSSPHLLTLKVTEACLSGFPDGPCLCLQPCWRLQSAYFPAPSQERSLASLDCFPCAFCFL